MGKRGIGVWNGDGGGAAVELTGGEIEILLRASKLDWASVEPAIFGTLFERSLDPAKRSQLGAHYTSKEDILLIVEPVLMEPLRRRWEEVRGQARGGFWRGGRRRRTGGRGRGMTGANKALMDFVDEISAVRVLDPACGSGNFLYVALKKLLDLKKEVSVFGAENGLSASSYGMEIGRSSCTGSRLMLTRMNWLRWWCGSGICSRTTITGSGFRRRRF